MSMAICHVRVKTGNKGKGASAVAKVLYICRRGKYEKSGDQVLHSRAGNMPRFAANDHMQYWAAADDGERANGRLYQEVEVALPIELNLEQQIDLAETFVSELTDNEKLPFTYAIHAGKGHNPHCHIVMNERANDGVDRAPGDWFRRANSKDPGKGGAKKSRTMKDPDWLGKMREGWADLVNQALKDIDSQERIDHRSYADQGIDKIPGLHLGPVVAAMERKGIRTGRGDEMRAIQRERDELDELENELAANDAELRECQAEIVNLVSVIDHQNLPATSEASSRKQKPQPQVHQVQTPPTPERRPAADPVPVPETKPQPQVHQVQTPPTPERGPAAAPVPETKPQPQVHQVQTPPKPERRPAADPMPETKPSPGRRGGRNLLTDRVRGVWGRLVNFMNPQGPAPEPETKTPAPGTGIEEATVPTEIPEQDHPAAVAFRKKQAKEIAERAAKSRHDRGPDRGGGRDHGR